MHERYEDLFAMALRQNQVTLFDLEGNDRPLDYQSHPCGVIEDVGWPSWPSEDEKITSSLQLTLDV